MKHTILIIDDDPDLVESARLVLESEGYQVRIARDGESGLVEMRRQRPDLVILDVMMSHMLEGIAVLREMMSDPALTCIPVLMVSAIQQNEYQHFLPSDEPCFNAIAFLTKPVQPEELLEAARLGIRSHLEGCEYCRPRRKPSD